MRSFKNQKGISLITIIIIVVIIIGIIIYIANYKDGHKLTSEEKRVYTTLRNTITVTKYSDSKDYVHTIPKEDFDIIGKMIKKEDNTNKWSLNEKQGWVMIAYDSYDALIERGYTVEETKEYEITYLYDGEYIAILYVRHLDNDYYLFDYEFKPFTELIPDSVVLTIE